MLKIGSLQHSILKHDNPLDSIQHFLDIFLKLDDQQKYDVVYFLSKNKSIDKNFYPLFLNQVYQNDKDFIKNIKVNLIVETYSNFTIFYYDFLNILCSSNYDFTSLKKYFEDIYYPKAKEFINKTFEYIDLYNKIRDF